MLWKHLFLGRRRGNHFFNLTCSLLGGIFLRFGLMGGIVSFSSVECGTHKTRNLNLKIFNVFGQLVFKKFDKRLHCLFLSIYICKYKIFLLCFINLFHCIPPSPDMGGNKWSSFLLIGDHLCIVYLLHKISALWTWRYLYLLISFYGSSLFCFPFLTSQDLFLEVGYSQSIPLENQSCTFLVSCFSIDTVVF